MSCRASLAAAILLALPAGAAAQVPAAPLDPEPAAPYTWRVLVEVRPHPLLTPAFREQFRRELHSALRPGIGSLGTVEVIESDGTDPLARAVSEQGFSALDPNVTRELTGIKTHVVRVEFRAGAYHVEARQFDGFTGLSSPTRHYTSRSPDLLARAAGLLIDTDFGLVGTVEIPPGAAVNPESVRVRIRGGRLGPLDRTLRVGDIFAVATVRRVESGGKSLLQTTPRDNTLLRVTAPPQDGVCRCVILSSYDVGLPASPTIAGYRCLRLGTVEAPVAVRLANRVGEPYRALSGFQVEAHPLRFGGFTDTRDILGFRDGAFRSDPSRPFPGMACVTVHIGVRQARFPVAITGPEPITLRIDLDAQDEERAAYERACQTVVTRAADARAAQVSCLDVVGRLITNRNHPEALKQARAGLQAARAADQTLTDEVGRLRKLTARSADAAPLLDAADRQLAALRRSNDTLTTRITDLDAAIKSGTDPTADVARSEAERVNAEITRLLTRGEVEEALLAFDQLVTLVPNDPDVKTRRDQLRAEAKANGAAHVQARTVLAEPWPANATVEQMRNGVGPLRTAIAVCKKANDRYPFRKLLVVTFGATGTRLATMEASLKPTDEKDRAILAEIKLLRAELIEIEKDVQAYLAERERQR